jgi:hypothetical protein
LPNLKISDFTALTTADAADEFPIVDTSVATTKKISTSDLKTSLGLSGTNTGDQDLSSYAVDANVVHKTGNETISGVKTFTDDIHLDKTTGTARIRINSGAATDPKILSFRTATLQRWAFRVDGSNDNFALRRYDDTGAFIDAPITADRSTGVVTINGSTMSDKAENFTDLGDVPSAYTGEADKWVKVNTGATGLEFQDLPIADLTTPGLIDVGGQTLSGGKYFVTNVADFDNFAINIASQVTVNDTFNNTNSINVGFYPTLVIQDDEDHDGLNVAGLIASTQLGNGDLNNILGGIAFTAAHEGSGLASAVLGVSGAANTTAGSIGNIALCIGGSLSVEHEGDGEITTGTSLNANVINFGGGDITEAICVNGAIESDGATGDIVDGYVLRCDIHDAVNKYGVVIDVAETKNTLHQLTLKAALDIVPSALVDAATIAIDALLSNVFDVTLTASRTLGNPSDAKDGQELLFRVRQDGTGGHTLSYDTKFRFGSTLPSITISTGAGSLNYITVRYNEADDTFDVLDFKGGF